jgi:hypothetical protein
MKKGALLLLIALTLAACSSARQVAPPSGASATASDAPALGGTAPTASVKAAITAQTYGSVEVTTDPGAQCTVQVRVSASDVGEDPTPKLAPQVAPASGVLRWTYSAPRVPQSRGEHVVACTRDGASSVEVRGIFDTYRPSMVATALTVRVSTDTPASVKLNPDPSLVPLRDASVAKMRATLPAEWKAATRGIGGLQVTDDSADIAVFVLAGRGTSVNRTGADGSEDIVIYVSGEFGPKTVENVVATTLHELGHIWCCRGADADDGGHWKEKLRDPGLYGVDKYGLMTDPVTCVTFGTIVSCPNRFSDREMRALGFNAFPPVTPDPCVSQGLSLQAQLAPLDASLTSLNAQVDANNTKLAQMLAQLRSMAAPYPAGLPPAVFAAYEALRAQYNALNTSNNRLIDQYNATLAQARAIDTQMRALACDWS